MKNIRVPVLILLVGLLFVAGVAGCNANPPQLTQPVQTVEMQPSSPAASNTPAAVATLSAATPTTVPTLLAGILSNKTNVAPHLIDRSPATGEEMALDGSLSLTFDQAMDAKTSTGAVTLSGPDQQSVTGTLSWSDTHTLVFKPAQPLKSASTYRLALSTQLASAQGLALQAPVSFSFSTVTDLQVSQVFPADQAVDVQNQALVTVMFNRPVVPLVIAEDQSKLPNPISIDPEISGTGQWLNTSVYIFRPTSFFKGGVNYKVTVKAGLADAAGSKLAQDYSWSFKTQAPSILAFQVGDNVNPEEDLPGVVLNPTFTVNFAQPMNTTSVENGLTLLSSASRKAMALTYQWNSDGTQLVFKPTQLLQLNTAYTLSVPVTVQSSDGGSLKDGLSWDFMTVMPPAIASAGLATGKDGPSSVFQVQFDSPIDFNSLAGKIIFSPALDNTTSQWYDENLWTMYFYNLAASSTYTVKILPGIKDPYGNAIQTTKTVIVTTPPATPSASLAMPYQPVYRVGGPQEFYVNYTNINRLQAALYHLSTTQFFGMLQNYQQQLNYSGTSADLVWQYQQAVTGSKDKPVLLPLKMTQHNGQPLSPGFYYLGMNASPVASGQKSTFLDFRLLMVTTDNVTLKTAAGEALVWLTELTSGAPSPGVPLKIYDSKFNVIGQGTTDKDGMLHINVPPAASGQDPNRFVLTDDPNHFGFADGNWGSGVSPSDFGIGEQYYQAPQNYSAYLYTDRPLYRPDQPVHFKGIVRSEDDLSYKLPDQSKVQVTIDDFQNKVYQETLTLSSFGSFEGTFQLAKDTALGPYEIYVTWPNSDQQIGSVNFNVAEYRLPEFQVDVATSPKNVLPGDPITANVDANYYSGGGLSQAGVDWTLSADPYSFTPPDKYSAYSFNDVDQDNWESLSGQPVNNPHQEIANGKGQTDANGHFSLTLPAQLGTAKTSQQLTFEATLTDFAGTTVSGRSTVVLNLSQVYPGIRSTSYVGLANKPATFDLVALDWDGKPLANQHVDVNIVERQWYSVQQEDANGVLQWKTTVKDIPVASYLDQTLGADGTGQISFTPDHGAIYKASITSKDSHGNANTASAYVWISGEAYIPWAQTNDRSFQVVTDKDSYAPGETAQLLIASPFQGNAYALVTVERGRVRQAKVTELTSNSTVYSLPITADMAPNVYVSVVVVKGVDANNPRPNFKVGMAKINVATSQQALKVTVTPDKSQVGPGDKVTYAIQTTAMDGTPAQSEISLALVDLAVLSLSDPNSIPALDYFYEKRGLGVSTSIAIVQSIEDFNAQLSENLTAQGRGAGSGGGGKGGGLNGVIAVRSNFPDTAYWQGQLDTDASGKASVTITLPDNLTTWRMDARAVTTDTRVGQTTVDVVSSKPLLVRPQTPRFFVSGDQVTLGAAVHNNTSQDLQVTVNLGASGLNLSSNPSQMVKIGANQQALVTWNASVPSDQQRADLVFSASGGGYQDASRPSLGTLSNQGIPIYKYEAPETVGTSGVLTKPGTQVETISLPQSMTVTKGQLSVELSPSLAAGITDGLTYLKTYPYECNEQTVSSFLPNVRTEQTLKAAGLSDPTLEANLKDQVNTALQKLYNGQNSDGGWGWWKGQNTDLTTTAYVALGMLEAKAAGYTVTDSSLTRAITYLQNQLTHFGQFDPPEQINRQAFVLYVLARFGAPDVSQSVALYDLRASMAYYARAYLLQTLYIIDPKDQRLPTLISDLNTAAIQSATGTHWEEKTPDYLNWNTDTRSTAIILSALIETDPGNALLPNAVRWLMSNRSSGGYWQSTQETAWVLLAMSNWIQKSGELNGNFQYAVAFNGKGLLDASANSSNIGQSQSLTVNVTDLLAQDVNRLVLAHDSGPGSLYYTAHLNVDLPVDQVKALDRGIIISRQYFYPNDLKTPVSSAKPGDVLLARLTLVATNTLHNILVEDPLPAGLEAIDTSLNSSPTNTMPDSFDWTRIGTDGWGWWFFSHVELRDEKVVLSTDQLPAGSYVYTYQVRASTDGVFNTIPPTAQELYFPEVYGRGDGSIFTVKP